LVSREVLRKRMRAPEIGLSIVSPALAMVLLSLAGIDIMPPKEVQYIPRKVYSPKCLILLLL
jgi:hypothetical protein